MKEKIYHLLSGNKFLFTIGKCIYDFNYYILKLKIIGFLFRIFPIKKNKIVVNSYFGRGYGDNGKPIVDELLKTKKNIDIVWILNKENINSYLPKGVRKVKYETIKCLFELVTAKVWIDNSRMLFVPPKRKKQFYIQTWHAGIGFKKCEKDSIKSLTKRYIKRAIKDSKNADLFISNSKWETHLYRSAFWYDGNILEVGIPRNDILINKKNHVEIAAKTKKKLGIKNNCRVILYAPTFRNYDDLSCYKIDVNKIIDFLNKSTNDNWVFLIRFHPNVSYLFNEFKFDNAIDVTNYDDLYELLITSDILISDYSSLMTDFSYLKRPVYMFATDIDKYKEDRDYLFDLTKLPFILCKSNEELISKMKNFDEKKYLDNLDKFYKNVGLNETGKSSQEIVKIIIKEMGID